MANYGMRIRSERAMRRMSQQDVCSRLGIQRITLVDIEADRIGIDDATYQRIVEAMGPIAEGALSVS